MRNNEKPLSKNIKELFTENNVRYEIPVYQRDYAWTESQIRQLIQDVADYAKEKGDSNYYIGTLIVYERQENNKVVFETIDGQQRLTTLSILLNLLKKDYSEVSWFEENILSFACRPKSTESLKNLRDGDVDGVSNAFANQNILQGYRDARKSLRKILAEYGWNNDATVFANYLSEKVYILRVPVPKDTDLNHYFEIMNSRGEQLEKHEVLKAECLKYLDDKEQIAFNKIWEAASNMERYVQYGFSTDERNALFGEKNDSGHMWDCLDDNLDYIYEVLGKNTENSNEEQSLEDIALGRRDNFLDERKKEDEDGNIRFNSVINFSNFLLHVLRIQVGSDIPLDDKRLLVLFEPYVKAKETESSDTSQERIHKFVKEFGYNLLKIKFLYDKYVIKREFSNGKDQWSLKRVRVYGDTEKKKSYSYVGTFSDSANSEVESEINHEILMLLAMFHVSTPTLVYKHWLNGALKWCFEQQKSISAESYKNYLEMMAEVFLRDRFLAKEPLDYYEIIYKNDCQLQNVDNSILDLSKLNAGTDVENFIFNYLDYLLWKNFNGSKSAFDVIGDNESLKNDSRISNFEYSFRSSVEHYYPQNPIEGPEFKIDNGPLNCFGNLCLISNEKNSRLSNYMPLSKKEHYAASEKIDSIKQRIMMAYEEWDERGKMDKNGISEINDHYQKMLGVLLDDKYAQVDDSSIAIVVVNDDNDEYSGEDLENDLAEYIRNMRTRTTLIPRGPRRFLNARSFWDNKRRIALIRLYPESVHGGLAFFEHDSAYYVEVNADFVEVRRIRDEFVKYGFAKDKLFDLYYDSEEDRSKLEDERFICCGLRDLLNGTCSIF